MDWKLELVAVPVIGRRPCQGLLHRAGRLHADHDYTLSDELRFVQLTPPGSACSIALGVGVTDAPPGSVKGLQLVVPDIEAARAELRRSWHDVTDVQNFDWGRFVFFTDPDGNGWSVQEIPARD